MEDEFWEIEDKQHGWYYLFQQLDQVARANAGTQLIAKEPMNIIRNRYRDVLPIDDTRVKLNNADCDYINANYVKEESVQRSYIMTQGPMGHTSSHFWQMVWEQNCAGIVMLNRCVEKGMNKCFQYWPAEVGQSLQFGPYIIENQFQQTEETFRLSMLTLSMSDSDEVKTVQHFHYIKWPDFNVPRTPDDFLQFLNAVRRGGILSPDTGPCVVHCSAGIGRSGTFALVDVILAQIEKSGGTADINIQQTLLRMRTQRLGLIQTPDQLRFSYIAILHGADRASKGQLDNDDDDEDSDSEEEGVASENDSEEERTGENEEKPPPLPPRASDSNKPQVDVVSDVVKEDDCPPTVVKRTLSLSGSSSSHSMSVTPEPPTIKEDDSPQPPPLPPRDDREPFLERREEGKPPVEVPSSLNAESSTANSDIHNSSEEAALRRRQAYQDRQARINTQVQDMKKNLQQQRGHSEQWNPKWLFIGVGCIIFYLLLRALY